MSKNRRPPKSVYLRLGAVTKKTPTHNEVKLRNRAKQTKVTRSSTKAHRVQLVIDCWFASKDFHPTVKRITAQLGRGWSETTVRQILEFYGPKNGIFLTEFERNN